MLKGQPLKFGGAWTSADADPGPDFYLERQRVGKRSTNSYDIVAFLNYLKASKRTQVLGQFNLLANDFKADLLLALSTNVALQSNASLDPNSANKLLGTTTSEEYMIFNLLEGRNDALHMPDDYTEQSASRNTPDTPVYAGIHMAYATQLYWTLAAMLESTATLDLGGPLAPLLDTQREDMENRISATADLASQHYKSYLTSGTRVRDVNTEENGTFYPDNLVAAARYHPGLMAAYPLLRSIDNEKRSRPGRFAALAHYEASTISGNDQLPDNRSRFRLPITPTKNAEEAETLIKKLIRTFGTDDTANPNPLARPSVESRKYTVESPLHMPSSRYTRDDGEFDAAGRSPAVLQVRYTDSASLLPVDRASLLPVGETTASNAYYTNAYVQFEVMNLQGAVGRLQVAQDEDGGNMMVVDGDDDDYDDYDEKETNDKRSVPSERLVDQLLQDASRRNPGLALPMHPGDYLDGLGKHTFHNHWTAMALWEHTPFLEWHSNITGLLLQNALNWTIVQRVEARTLEILNGSHASKRVEAMLGSVLDQLSRALLYGEHDSQYRSVFMSMYHEEEAVAEHTPILREEVVTYILWTFQIQLDQERYASSNATGRTKQPDEVASEATVRNVQPEYVPPLTEGLRSDRLASLYAEMLSSLRVLRLDYDILYEAIRTFWLHSTPALFAPTVDEPRVRTFITTHIRNIFHRNFDERDGFRGPPRAKKIRRPSDSAVLGVFVLDGEQAQEASPAKSAGREFMARMISRVITSVVKDLLDRDLTPTLQVNTVASYEAYTAAFFGKNQATGDDRAFPVGLSAYVRQGMAVRVNREVDRLVDELIRHTFYDLATDMFARYVTMLYGSDEIKNRMRDTTDDDLTDAEDDQILEATVEVLDAFLFLNGVGPRALDLGQFYTDALLLAGPWGITEADLPGASLRELVERTEIVVGAFPHLDRKPLVARYPKTRARTLGPNMDQRPSPVPRFNDTAALMLGPFSTASMLASMRNDMPLIVMHLYDKLKYSFKSAASPRSLTLKNIDAKTGTILPLVHVHPQRALPAETESLTVQLPPNTNDTRRWRTNTFSSWIRATPLYDRQLAYMHRMMKHDEFTLASDRRDCTVQFVWERTNTDVEATFTYVAPHSAKLAHISWRINGATVRSFYSLLDQEQDVSEAVRAPEGQVRWFKTKMRVSRAEATHQDTAVDRSFDDSLLINCDIVFYWDAAGSFPSPARCASYVAVKARHKRPINGPRMYTGPRFSDIMQRNGRTKDEERQLGMLRTQLRIDNQRRKREGQEEGIIPYDANYYHDLYHHTSLYRPDDILRRSIDVDLAPTRPYDTTNAYAGNASERGAREFVYAKVTA